MAATTPTTALAQFGFPPGPPPGLDGPPPGLGNRRLASVVLLALVALLRVLPPQPWSSSRWTWWPQRWSSSRWNWWLSLGLALTPRFFSGGRGFEGTCLRLSGPGLHPGATLAPPPRGLGYGYGSNGSRYHNAYRAYAAGAATGAAAASSYGSSYGSSDDGCYYTSTYRRGPTGACSSARGTQ